jgi:inorganic triphosphatase YgiF
LGRSEDQQTGLAIAAAGAGKNEQSRSGTGMRSSLSGLEKLEETVDTEIELKLVASKRALRRTMTQPWLKKMAGDTMKHQHLTSVYFDTPKFALRDRGVSLRVRRAGDQRLQTIKATSGALVARDEWEQSIEGDQTKLELASGTALGPLLIRKFKDQLKPVFETDVDRVTMHPRVGKSEIELAFDAGRINTADAQADITEIEIELKNGKRRNAMLARRFARHVPITYEPRAKSERAYALLEGSLDAPIFARSISIPSSAPAEDALVIIGFECLRGGRPPRRPGGHPPNACRIEEAARGPFAIQGDAAGRRPPQIEDRACMADRATRPGSRL